MIIHYDGQDIEMSDFYSFKNLSGRSYTEAQSLVPGLNIYASSFASEEPDTVVFPEDMVGVTFYNCNLDNVYVPPGNTIIGSTPKRFKVQNDLRDWLVDENGNPVSVVNEDHWYELGYSCDPADIPAEKIGSVEEIPRRAPWL